jgi:anaerobic magnesium-protoporphyrin IX monomethyl ester cyclase
MKVLFTRHPKYTREGYSMPKEIGNSLGIYLPYGMAILAAVLREKGHEVFVVDAYAEGLSEAEHTQRVAEIEPDLIGVGPWTESLIGEMEGARILKNKLPGVPLVVGGPHASLYPKETLDRYSFVDYVVFGEAEETILELVDNLHDPERLKDVPGVGLRIDGEAVLAPPRPPVQDLDSLPFPAFDLFPMEKYFSSLAKKDKSTYILSTRGCPFKCRYCTKPVADKRIVRYTSPDYILKLLNHLVFDHGMQEVHFFDDTFTLDKKRVLTICDGINNSELAGKLSWTIRTRVDTVNPQVLEALKKAGCYRVGYGVESGNPEILKAMDRGISLKKAFEVISYTKKIGLETAANYMIGYPGESKQTYRNTLQFAKKLNTDFANFSVTVAKPDSLLYEDYLEIHKRDIWREFALGKIDYVKKNEVRFAGKDYGIEDLDRMSTRAYVIYYFRPVIIWRHLKRLSSWKQFKIMFNQAIGMLKSYNRQRAAGHG